MKKGPYHQLRNLYTEHITDYKATYVSDLSVICSLLYLYISDLTTYVSHVCFIRGYQEHITFGDNLLSVINQLQHLGKL